MTRVIHEHVDFAAFSPDASHFATGSASGRVLVWKMTAGAEVALMEHDDLVTVAFSQDGKLFLTIAGNDIRLWEMPSGQELKRIQLDSEPAGIALSPPDGKYLAVTSSAGTLRILESLTGREVVSLGGEGPVTAFSPDGKRLATAGRKDDSPRVWEIPSGRQLLQLPQTQSLDAVLFSPDGSTLVTLSGDRNVIVVWNAASGQVIARIVQKEGVEGLVFSPDGRSLAALSDGGMDTGFAQVWDAASGRERARVAHEAESPRSPSVRTGAILPPAASIRRCGSGIRITARQVARPVRGTLVSGMNAAQVTALEFALDGRLVVASGDGTASIWEPVNWREVGRIHHKAPSLPWP